MEIIAITFNLADCFFDRARQQPDQLLIIGSKDKERITYSQFAARVRELAISLQNAGVKAGDNVGLHYPNGSDFIAYNYAVWACRATVTPIPVELAEQEKHRIFQFIHLDHVICSARLVKVLASLASEQTPTFTDTAVLFKVKSFCAAPLELKEVNAAFIRFTSGTTDNAKGVVLSHETIYTRIHAANEAMQLKSGDRVLWLLSMAYHFAVSIVAYLSFGATIILPKNSFGISLLQAATQHQATLIYGAPQHYQMMLSDNTGLTLPASLDLAVVTTAALSPRLAEAFYQRYGYVLNEAYGIIELGLPSVNVSRSLEKQGSVGIPLTAYELTLDKRDSEQSGEILVRTEAMLDAYYSPWQSREQMLSDYNGWFRTGDIGRIDNDGFLYIVGRNKELMSVAGMKFFPREVEDVLQKHPAIREACVFPLKKERLGEVPVAMLVPANGDMTQPTEKELKRFCTQYLATYKQPIHFYWVEQLAYTASGKLVRDVKKLMDKI